MFEPNRKAAVNSIRFLLKLLPIRKENYRTLFIFTFLAQPFFPYSHIINSSVLLLSFSQTCVR